MLLGGYDDTVIIGGADNIQWIKVPNDTYSWNSTIHDMTLANNVVWTEETSHATVTFVTGYRYIGLPTSLWTAVCEQLN